MILPAALALACCIDSPTWRNPRETAPLISCEDVLAGKLGWSIGGGFATCEVTRKKDGWHYEGEIKGGGTYSFESLDPGALEARLNKARALSTDDSTASPAGEDIHHPIGETWGPVSDGGSAAFAAPDSGTDTDYDKPEETH